MKIIFLLLLIASNLNVFGQVNLVPNPSFEIFSQCPDPATVNPMPNRMIELATGWVCPNDYTPDYFATCVTSDYGIPDNNYGYQNARTGNAYAGLISSYGTSNVREYIQTQLTSPLIEGKQYLVTFYVSLAKKCTYAANDIGAYFSSTPISSTNILVFPYTPQVSNYSITNPLTNMVDWTIVSGSFTAVGGEEYLTIGNFNDDVTTDTSNTSALSSPAWEASYHYIDDVSVVCVDCTTGIDETNIDNKINVFPNPVTDYLNVKFEDIYPVKITVYKTVGETLLAQRQITGNTQINVSEYQTGVYFLKIETKDITVVKQFLIIK